jgi:hypothetical protein
MDTERGITDYERSIQAPTLTLEAFDRPGSVSRETGASSGGSAAAMCGSIVLPSSAPSPVSRETAWPKRRSRMCEP